mmetsp:Transcript_47236/g.145711  ORF Transcript_47236/g.145711 Transcript_47236/m.145711 type:complete len:244 (-) Transcript_47236:87-818(-)
MALTAASARICGFGRRESHLGAVFWSVTKVPDEVPPPRYTSSSSSSSGDTTATAARLSSPYTPLGSGSRGYVASYCRKTFSSTWRCHDMSIAVCHKRRAARCRRKMTCDRRRHRMYCVTTFGRCRAYKAWRTKATSRSHCFPYMRRRTRISASGSCFPRMTLARSSWRCRIDRRARDSQYPAIAIGASWRQRRRASVRAWLECRAKNAVALATFTSTSSVCTRNARASASSRACVASRRFSSA